MRLGLNLLETFKKSDKMHLEPELLSGLLVEANEITSCSNEKSWHAIVHCRLRYPSYADHYLKKIRTQVNRFVINYIIQY